MIVRRHRLESSGSGWPWAPRAGPCCHSYWVARSGWRRRASCSECSRVRGWDSRCGGSLGVAPLDPVAFGGVGLVVVVMVLVAGWAPARWAAGVEPMEALRVE
jgi:hypothetical protein